LASGPSRRAVLAASAAAVPLLVSACRGVQVLGSPPPPAADVRLLRVAIAAERAMVARYHAALAQASGSNTAAALTSILAEHQQHLAQLTARLVGPAQSSLAQSSLAPSSPAPPGPGGAGSGLAAALEALETAEQDASARLASQLLDVPPSLAQLLASISASEATHVPVLKSAGRAR
jgi:rubrerythrin